MQLAQAVNQYNYSHLNSPEPINLSEQQLNGLVEELKEYYEIYHPYFKNAAQIENGYNYLLGLLKPMSERKSGENIALATAGIGSVRPLQSFVGQSRWESEALLSEHCAQTGTLLGDKNGVLILDGSDFPKQGDDSVGVKRQWCGQLGKTANCQAGVFTGYSSRHGYTLLNRRLYMPKEWFTPAFAAKRYKTGVPAALTFQTKNELAWQMIEQVAQAGTLPIRWITMDEAFGRDSQLLDRIDAQTSYAYFAEVPKDTALWPTAPKTYLPEPPPGRGRPATQLRLAPGEAAPLTVEAFVATFSQQEWQLHALKEGSKGIIFAQLATRRIVAVRDGLPGPQLWLIVRRDPLDPTDLKYFLSNAAPDTSIDDFATVCALRWPIETIFQQAKQYLGFNEYETRSWLGWHHHMTLVILAFGFLARSHFLLKEDAPALTLPQVVALLAAVLPQKQFRPKEALELLRYKQHRIASAKRSHYFMQKKKLSDVLFAAQ
jgi:SRSO17 transposase